ncbi:MAG: hypothetical protein WB689_39395 [Xanthobacteraceae bacterium]
MTDNDFVECKDDQASIVALDAVLRTDLPAFVRKVFGTVSPGSLYLPTGTSRRFAMSWKK